MDLFLDKNTVLRTGRGWRLGALDDEPQHERYLREEGGLGEEKQLVLVLRCQ